jgi:spore cortex formation protein SpoVR/YcgB (stage V sporulation)
MEKYLKTINDGKDRIKTLMNTDKQHGQKDVKKILDHEMQKFHILLERRRGEMMLLCDSNRREQIKMYILLCKEIINSMIVEIASLLEILKHDGYQLGHDLIPTLFDLLSKYNALLDEEFNGPTAMDPFLDSKMKLFENVYQLMSYERERGAKIDFAHFIKRIQFITFNDTITNQISHEFENMSVKNPNVTVSHSDIFLNISVKFTYCDVYIQGHCKRFEETMKNIFELLGFETLNNKATHHLIEAEENTYHVTINGEGVYRNPYWELDKAV